MIVGSVIINIFVKIASGTGKRHSNGCAGRHAMGFTFKTGYQYRSLSRRG
jgi:hypothetical protein